MKTITELKIVELYCDSGIDEAYYCKGHVDKQEFSDTLNKEWRGPANPIPLEKIHHIYARLIPVAPGTHDYDQKFIRVDKPGRGAFKATTYGAENFE